MIPVCGLVMAGACLAAPVGPGSAAYRADLDRAVRKYRGAQEVPAAAVSYLGRLHQLPLARVRADLKGAECHEVRKARIPHEAIAPVFEQVCSNCHSPTGVGDGEMAEVFGVPVERMDLVGGRSGAWAIQDVADVIRHGRGEMPSYAEALTAEQIRDVVLFLRRMGDACGPAVEEEP